MDKYIIMTASITKVGGAQLYTNYKREYMESKGFSVDIFSCNQGPILMNEFVRYKDNIIEELGFLPMYFGKTKQNEILEKMVSRYDSENYRIIIESHNTTMHVWGELLAARLKAKHIVYEITERSRCKKELFHFFKFKYDRREMAGIKDSSLQYYFRDYMDVPLSKKYSLLAYYPCKQVDDVDYNAGNIREASPMCTIGILGRLEKPFVLTVAKQLKAYIECDSNNNYTVIIIGGQKEGCSTKNKIQEIYKDIQNVSLVFTGFLYPIPRGLLSKIDIGISSAGAVVVLAKEGIPTISIDGHDMLPLGVYGVTTDNTLFRKGEEIVKLSNWIKRIQETPELYRKDICIVPDTEDHLAHHIEFINESEQSIQYYTHFSNGLSFKQLIYRALGKDRFKQLRKFISGIFK